MKKLLFASVCALTLLSYGREESEIQGENDPKNINKSTLVKGGEASKTWEKSGIFILNSFNNIIKIKTSKINDFGGFSTQYQNRTGTSFDTRV